MFKWFKRAFALIFLSGLVLAAIGLWWIHQPMLEPAASSTPLLVAQGASAGQVARSAAAASNASAAPKWLTELAWVGLLRASGKARSIKSGEYEVAPGDTPRRLLEKLVDGQQVLRQLTIVEGWTFRQILQTLQKEKRLAQSIPGQSQQNAEKFVAQRLGIASGRVEGRFFPDTYRFATGQTDLDVLRAAALAMDKQLSAAWDKRPAATVLQSPEQALILASIVEKETGAAADRGQIAGVFHNRLRIGMRLQTDPTVIYGLGESFDGNLRKVDLLTDTPFNTYTRAGLPPTPIAMPGKAAIDAAIQPAATNAMYFVARGDGTSQFSATLAEHNRAVDKYIRGR